MNKNIRPKTFITSVRLDIKDIANIALYFDKKVILPFTRSELVSSALHHYALIVTKELLKEEIITSSEEALELLHKMRLWGGRHPSRALVEEIGKERAIMEDIHREDYDLDKELEKKGQTFQDYRDKFDEVDKEGK